MRILTRRAILQSASLPFWLGSTLQAQAPSRDYDESKVRKYALPDPLQGVPNAEAWRKHRRTELLRLFAENEYGRKPGPPKGVHFAVTPVDENALGGKARRKLVSARLSKHPNGPEINLLIYLPKNQSGPTPIFLGVNFRGNHTVNTDPAIPLSTKWVYNNGKAAINNRSTEASRGMQSASWPVEQILARGYGLATFYAGDVFPDHAGGYEASILPLFYQEGQTKREPNEWGAIGAWSWGLSRAMDYLETDHDIDRNRVIVMGHSRMGKTALWAGASDPRFSMIVSNCSGAGGATLARRRFGESVKDLNTTFPWWFCENYRKYSDNEDAFPVDQHELIALCAPRPIYIGTAEQDRGSDPKGQFLSAVNASPVYKLLGTSGFAASEMPPVHKPVMTTIGFHVRAGRHDITTYDWEQYMNHADIHLLNRAGRKS